MSEQSGQDIFLQVRNVTKRFPGVIALQRVDLDVQRGEVHMLLGENGAGKSSLVKLLAGIYQPDEGEILVEGRPYHPTRPLDAFHAGIRVVHQELNLLPYLSVAENLFLEAFPQRYGLMRYRELHDRARLLLDEVGLHIAPTTRVEQLGIAQMQLIEIAKAIGHDSKMIILDEPTATLTPREISRLFEIIHKLREQGVTFIYISHRLHEIYEIGDRVTVLRNGQHIATRAVGDVTLNEVVKMMVGRDIQDEFSFPTGIVTGREMLRVHNLQVTRDSDPISFSVNAGEVVGIAGLVGSGRTEAVRAIYGADRRASGDIFIDGEKVQIDSPKQAVQHGLSLLTEDRKDQGLLLDLPLTTNITITDLTKISRNGLVDYAAEKSISDRMIQDLHIKTPSARQSVRNLSGGNQQKVVIAKWLFSGAKVLIFDEPTRGIDVGARQEIYELLWSLGREGKAILAVSSDLSELMGICHRIIVFSRGKIAGEVSRDQFDQERILALAYQEYVNS